MRTPADTVYWTKFLLGVAAAVLCVVLNLTDLYGLIFGVALYFGSYVLYRYILGIDETISSTRLYTIGIGAYFLTWITLWAILNTLLHPLPI